MAAKKNSKTARGRGTIVQKAPNKFLCRVYRGLDASGKRQYQSATVTGKRKDAEQELTKMLRDGDTQPTLRASTYTVAQWIERWLRSKTGISPSTRKDYRERMDRDIIPYIGGVKLTKLSRSVVQTLYRELHETPDEFSERPMYVREPRKLSPRTIQYTHTVLKQCFDDAIEEGILGVNPIRRVERPKVTKAEQQVLSPEQCSKLMVWAEENDPDFTALWTLLLTSGMRPGEALAVRWEDLVVDESTGEALLYIRRALKRDGEVEAFGKTEGSTKPISLPAMTVTSLQRHKVRQNTLALRAGSRYERQGWIFSNKYGNILDPAKVRNRWKAACRKAGVPAVRLYDTRHSHATALLIAGVNPKIVQERLRHSDVQLTLNTYSHVLPETERKTAGIVEGLFNMG
jgi:integrase